ncbi:MAG: UDP-glucose 4-epimerase, partial [Pseudonocardiales bacterium]|nr:UDP-glucose 4-epimerase [Pseudonocardiales bacterium]
YFRNNVTAGINLLDAMIAAGVQRFVFSSTCATFGIPDRGIIDETLPQRPINPYGESKLIFEKILRWYDEIHQLRYVALRYFNAAGASERFGEDHRIETHLIPNVLKVALGQKEYVSIFGTDYATPDGTCIRDYIHILDLAEAHLRALDWTAQHEQQHLICNLGSGSGNSVREVVEAVRSVTGAPTPVIEGENRPGDPAVLIASNDRARTELGWLPTRDLTTMVSDAWAFARLEYEGAQA